MFVSVLIWSAKRLLSQRTRNRHNRRTRFCGSERATARTLIRREHQSGVIDLVGQTNGSVYGGREVRSSTRDDFEGRPELQDSMASKVRYRIR